MRTVHVGWATALWLAFGCSAGGNEGGRVVEPLTPEPSGEDSNGSGGSASGGTGAVLPVGEGLGELDLSPGEGEVQGCQQASRSFDPEIPTVMLLVDRSGSMFQQFPAGGNAWEPLREGILAALGPLDGQVRFGFAAFAGIHDASVGQALCPEPEMETVLPALGNFGSISELYAALDQLGDNSTKVDTPTLPALSAVADALWADEGTGDKFILYITDGEPDYCDDGNAFCPPDSVTAKIQQLAAGIGNDGSQQEPIRTLVFGLQSPLANVKLETLQGFANAGAGQPVAAPIINGTPNTTQLYDNCNVVPGWEEFFLTTGKPAERTQTTADYSAEGGTATLFQPDVTDPEALLDEIRVALAGVKSCEFNLGDDGVEVDIERPDLGDKAKVLLNETPVPYDPVNGWHMLNPTTVELVGEACDTFRAPVQTDISFDFPCDIIVPL